MIKVMVSHAHDEKGLAKAWKDLLETISLGAVEVWFSSDIHSGGGMKLGSEWRENLYSRISESDMLIAIQTPYSIERPWIIWECGVASSVGKVRGIVPVVYQMGRGDLPSPLSSYQVYSGDDTDQVKEVCERLVTTAGLNPPKPHMYPEPLRVYQEAVAMHRPRKMLLADQMVLWRLRFEEQLRSGRVQEVMGLRQLMYTSLAKPFRPVEPTTHELLSRILLETRHFKESIEEVDYALAVVSEDVQLLHRKALALMELGELGQAELILKGIIALDRDLAQNPEIAGLEGRIHRHRWEQTHSPDDLQAAIDSYHAAYKADRMQYYPGINAASLSLEKGDLPEAAAIYEEILATCRQLQQWSAVSYWVDFTAGEALLGMGKATEAIEEYKRGLSRQPSPQERHRLSAANGAARVIRARKMDASLAQNIQDLLK